MSRSDLQDLLAQSRAAYERAPDTAIAHEPYRFAVRVTSGTTGGKPLLTVFFADYPFAKARHMRRVLIATGSWNSRLANVRHPFLSSHPTETLAIDVRDVSDPARRSLLEAFDADGIIGFPSLVAKLLSCLSEASRRHIRHVSLVGERLTPTLQSFFLEMLPNAHIAMVYALAEIGEIADQCTYLSANSYHPIEPVTVSIVNKDAEGVGTLLISRKIFGGYDVVDYAPGDVGREIASPCPCGALVTFEHMGRAGYDFIKISGLVLTTDAFDAAILRAGLAIEDYRIEARHVKEGAVLKGEIICVLRGEIDASVQQTLRNELESMLLTPTKTFGALVAEGVLLPLCITIGGALKSEQKLVRLRLLE